MTTKSGAKIPLAGSTKFALVDDEDVKFVSRHAWRLVNGQPATTVKGQTLYLANLVMCRVRTEQDVEARVHPDDWDLIDMAAAKWPVP